MKDPASDFSVKQQPLEYYKCHLHTVLEKKKEEEEGRFEVLEEKRRGVLLHNLDGAEIYEVNGMSLSQSVNGRGGRSVSL